MTITTENRTERINVLVTPSEKARIEKMAKAGDMRLSDFVRRQVLSPRQDEASLEEVQALAEAVGGAARRLHKKLDQGLSDIANTRKAITELRKAAS